MKHALLALVLLLAAAGAAPVSAQQPARPALSDDALDAQVRQVAAELRCPVCQGLSIEASPSELSNEMRDVIREQLAAGRTPAEVKAYFVSKYGEWILLAPKASGFNLAVYLLPLGALVLGLGAIAYAVRRWTSGAPETDAG